MSRLWSGHIIESIDGNPMSESDTLRYSPFTS